MKVLVFGATGGTGRAIVERAVERGHRVSAFARKPEALGPVREELHVIAGDATDGEAVRAAIAGHDAVISSLGSRPWRGDRICSRGTTSIVAGMQATGVRRLLIVSSVGVRETLPYADLMTKLARATFLSGLLADKDAMEELVKASELDWILVRPVALTSGKATGRARVATDESIRGGFVSRADVAEFMVAQLEKSEYVRKAPSIAGP